MPSEHPEDGSPVSKTEDLAVMINDSCMSCGSDLTFLPASCISKLVTRENVTAVLEEAGYGVGNVDEHRRHILDGNARRIFLIFVLLANDKPLWFDVLQTVLQKKISDDELPFVFELENKKKMRFRLFSSENKQGFRVSIPGLSESERHLLRMFQNRINVPIFTKERFLYTISDDQLLPFLGGSEGGSNAAMAKGSFGEVRRFEIHESHLCEDLQKDCVRSRGGFFEIAVKSIRRDNQDKDFFASEADALETQRGTFVDQPCLIRPIAAYQTSHCGCIIFPWATGGNLLQFWERNNSDRENVDKLFWIIGQFRDVAGTLDKLLVNNFRHGDLKPENILYFERKTNSLQISDMGLSKFHELSDNTMNRNGRNEATSTPAGTLRYAPPQIQRTKDGAVEVARSRMCDIWSMGCILFELLVWMVYGYDVLRGMRFEVERYYNQGQNEIDLRVVDYMNGIEKIVGAGNSVQKSLLELIRSNLLIISIPASYDIPEPGCRSTAAVMHKKLKTICQECEKSLRSRNGYLSVVTRSQPMPAAFTTGGRLAVDERSRGGHPTSASRPRTVPEDLSATLLSPHDGVRASRQGSVTSIPILTKSDADGSTSLMVDDGRSRTMSDNQQQSAMIHDAWTSMPDNKFALSYFREVAWDKVKPRQRPRSDIKLCSLCGSITSPRLFDSQCHLGQLKSRASSCELCNLLYQSLYLSGCYNSPSSYADTVSLLQTDGVISVANGRNLLSVYVPPYQDTISATAQIGLPCLLEPASFEQITLLKTWIGTCNNTHKCMVDDYKFGRHQAKIRPRRLLDMRDPLHLVDTNSLGGILPDYVVLSHCWGKLTEEEKLCTYNSNISQMMKDIPLHSLPRTFLDAVTVARGIGASYIWIDSLCIIQDNADDWASEAVKMGDIFSSAYCTIAATSAMSSLDGFLGPRPEHHIVSLETATGPVYVRSNIDNFHKDVEMGPLNQRGWVLQELALSRRSIFFTSIQIYWMCGETLYTETLSRLENAKAAFLGDAHFPKSVIKYYRDGRQMLVQDLYERYSNLAFTNQWDRPVAILGLEDRLSKAFGTRAAHGMLALYFPRLLLWKRSGSRQMPKIVQPPGSRHKPPSWSWFSKSGPIEYLPLEFEKVAWEIKEFDSPFKYAVATFSPGQPKYIQSEARQSNIIPALARRLHLTFLEFRVSICQDQDDEYNRFEDLYGVIIGRDKMPYGGRKTPRVHILVIRKARGGDFFERVGVASLQQRQVDDESTRVMIH